MKLMTDVLTYLGTGIFLASMIAASSIGTWRLRKASRGEQLTPQASAASTKLYAGCLLLSGLAGGAVLALNGGGSSIDLPWVKLGRLLLPLVCAGSLLLTGLVVLYARLGTLRAHEAGTIGKDKR